MIKFNEIALDTAPRNKLLPKLPPLDSGHEMSGFDSAFLCGALKKFQPKKIIEVGITSRITTSIILQCLEDIGQEYEMHSVDIATNRYHAAKSNIARQLEPDYAWKYIKETAISNLPSDNNEAELHGKHIFHDGQDLIPALGKIGNEIDFVVFNVISNEIPGEILDFLAILPYLKNDAVVVLRNVIESQLDFNKTNNNASALLFSTVDADKFINFPPQHVDLVYAYPNIGAFQINEFTRANIENVFLALALRWQYFPQRGMLRGYYNIYKKNYSPEICKLYENILKMNYMNLKIDDVIKKARANANGI